MKVTLLKNLQERFGALPEGVAGTRSVTELHGDQLKAVCGGAGSGSSSSGSSSGGSGSSTSSGSSSSGGSRR